MEKIINATERFNSINKVMARSKNSRQVFLNVIFRMCLIYYKPCKYIIISSLVYLTIE